LINLIIFHAFELHVAKRNLEEVAVWEWWGVGGFRLPLSLSLSPLRSSCPLPSHTQLSCHCSYCARHTLKYCLLAVACLLCLPPAACLLLACLPPVASPVVVVVWSSSSSPFVAVFAACRRFWPLLARLARVLACLLRRRRRPLLVSSSSLLTYILGEVSVEFCMLSPPIST
jgi:hypothetical protein